MQDVTQIDWKRPYGKIASIDIASQKVFFTQNGIDYDAGGKCLDPKQIKKHYSAVAANAQKAADDAREAAEAAQIAADEAMGIAQPKGPETVAQLTEALTAAGVEIPDGSLSADLKALWADHLDS